MKKKSCFILISISAITCLATTSNNIPALSQSYYPPAPPTASTITSTTTSSSLSFNPINSKTQTEVLRSYTIGAIELNVSIDKIATNVQSLLRDSLHGIKHDIVLTDAYGKPKLILNQKYKEFLDSENRQRVPAGLKLRGAIREIVASGDQVLIK